MTFNYWYFDPSGNTTLIVDNRDGALPREQYAACAKTLMERLDAEQVGYFERAGDPSLPGRLQMMGGEFCGNASRSFAFLLKLLGLAEGDYVRIEVSGYPGALHARFLSAGETRAEVACAMPCPTAAAPAGLTSAPGAVAVAFDGITHMVLKNRPCDEKTVDAVLKEVYAAPDPPDALGVLFWDADGGAMTPAVYVPAVGSLVYESSCGSGSVAVAAALAREKNAAVHDLALRQRGGVLTVSYDPTVPAATLAGEIILRTCGEVTL